MNIPMKSTTDTKRGIRERQISGAFCGKTQGSNPVRLAKTSTVVAWPTGPIHAGVLSALQQTDTFAGVRLELVDRLRRAIADGSYRVPAEALADKLMSYVLSEVR